MTALRRLFRTTAFKLALIYLLAYSGLTVFIISYISYNTQVLLTRQIEETIAAEINSLTEQYRRGGLAQLVASVEIRSRRPGASLYLVSDYAQRTIAGNIADPPSLGVNPGAGRPIELAYRRLEGDAYADNRAMVRVLTLPGGFRLLVGRDLAESDTFHGVIREALQLSGLAIPLIALATWIFVNRAVLKRVEKVAVTSRQIMSGDLSRRLEVTGSGDEFDDLAESLNQMLSRIEMLMTGLKEVSDDIAHDLRTPLSRLRSRLEAALRGPAQVEIYGAAIEASLEEADQLIQVFEALLRIARMEAGSSGDEMVRLDAAEIVADVAELYEPVVEDAGGRLENEITGPLPLAGNRALISQALTNLLDNAIKYGLDPQADPSRPGTAGLLRLKGERIGPEIRLSVSDTGPGIPAADHERVVQRFVRLDGSRSRPGSGLGLSLVAAVARIHGGRLVFQDNRPGLQASLVLPVAGNNKTARESAHDPPTADPAPGR